MDSYGYDYVATDDKFYVECGANPAMQLDAPHHNLEAWDEVGAVCTLTE